MAAAPNKTVDLRPAKTGRRRKSGNPESEFRFALDTCSKRNDLAGALVLYDSARAGGLRLGLYHFNALLYLCSNSSDISADSAAVEKGFEIFDHMLACEIPPSEATITGMARLAVAKGDGDLAFCLVAEMDERFGISPKLRTYGPALLYFCERGELEKAYMVEENMVSLKGISLEEPEIYALLKASAAGGRGDKVYYFLQKLRSAVKAVKEETAEVIEGWFRGEVAAGEGRVDWDEGEVRRMLLRNGGGWHGLGWLGKGKWEVCRTRIDVDGHCLNCGETLACVDIDVTETKNFAKSIASLAMQREAKAKFSEFQEWLDKHSDYEAIVDGANVGYYQRNFSGGGFTTFQVDMVVKELCKRSQNKWPLVVLHSQRVQSLMENPSSRKILEEWSSHGALYTTPKGSNDDWYWIYAAVKSKCLIVTNDEMRDHIFELLGQNFFLKWKESHQVHYTFVKGEVKLQMPPSYSSVIQEADTGTWHVPLSTECDNEASRTWLCINRKEASRRSGEVLPKCSNACASDSLACSDQTMANSCSVTGKRKR